MLAMRTASQKKHREEGEKPFWISFSDLMSALMVLFLVAMTVALLAITNEISESERAKTQREEEIDTLMERIKDVVKDFPGVTVRGRSVDFGDRARFDTNSHHLQPEQARLLRALVPRILEVARDPLGEKWIKRVVVEGFAEAVAKEAKEAAEATAAEAAEATEGAAKEATEAVEGAAKEATEATEAVVNEAAEAAAPAAEEAK